MTFLLIPDAISHRFSLDFQYIFYISQRFPPSSKTMCSSVRTLYRPCGHLALAPPVQRYCSDYPGCNHYFWGRPFDEGGPYTVDDIPLDGCPKCSNNGSNRWPPGFPQIPDDPPEYGKSIPSFDLMVSSPILTKRLARRTPHARGTIDTAREDQPEIGKAHDTSCESLMPATARPITF